MMKRYILHLDVDALSTSVKEITDPSIKGKPLIVGAPPEQRGVVASATCAASPSASGYDVEWLVTFWGRTRAPTSRGRHSDLL